MLYSFSFLITALLTDLTEYPVTYEWISLTKWTTEDKTLSLSCSDAYNWVYCEWFGRLTLFKTNTFWRVGW